MIGTPDRILDVAELLFAEQGFDATSVREITRRADANLAAVNYHFGSKVELLDAVINRRIGPINQQRLQQLDELLAAKRPPSLEQVLVAFLAPPFQLIQELGARQSAFLGLITRFHLDNAIRDRFRSQTEVVLSRFFPVLQELLPNLSKPVLQQRLFFAIGSLSHAVTYMRNAAALKLSDQPPQCVLQQLIAFTTAGLRAEVPSEREL